MLAALWLGLATVFAGASAAVAQTTEPDDIGELAERLREDPILVDDAMGNGHAADVHAVLTELAEGVDVPVYVVLAGTPLSTYGEDDIENNLAALLNQELGEGLYIVATPSGWLQTNGWGAAAEYPNEVFIHVNPHTDRIHETRATSQAHEAALVLAAAQNPGSPIASAQLEELQALPWSTLPRYASARADAADTRIVTTVVTVLSVLIAGAILIFLSLRYPLGARGERPPEAVPPPDDIGAKAREQVDQVLAQVLALPDQQSRTASLALDYLDAAETVLNTGDALDAVGAMVLARQTLRLIEQIDDPDEAPYRPCFINPLHGEARTESKVPGTTLRVPVCRRCDEEPQPYLGSTRGRRTIPYVETSTIWARTGFGGLVDDLADQVMTAREARR